MRRWFRRSETEPLTVSMTSIKLGDRLLVIGASDTSLIAALATKAGLTGRACMVEEDDALRARAAAAVEREGALVESFTAPFSTLPFEAGAFDVVVARNALRSMLEERRRQFAAGVHRVLRPGGRCVVIEGHRQGGLASLLKSESSEPGLEGIEAAFTAAGFRGVRRLAEREGLAFVEGVKPGAEQSGPGGV
jgi:ubiquinone/menaquinone biosynthesis C-methylase UbiE